MPKIKIRNLYTILLIFACFLIFVAITTIGTFLALDILYSSKFFPRTEIAGVSVGGKTKEETKDLLTSKVQEWSEKTLKINGEEKKWEVLNKDLGVDFNIDQATEDVFNEGKKGNIADQFIKRMSVVIFGSENPLYINKDDIEKTVQKISQEADINAFNVGLKIEEGGVNATDEKSGKEVETIDLKYQILNYAFYLYPGEISLPESIVYPNSNTEEIDNIKKEAENLLKTNIMLKAKNKQWSVSQKEVQNWIDIRSQDEISVIRKAENYGIKIYLNKLMENLWDVKFLNEKLEIKLKKEKVSEFLKKIAGEIDREPQNASLGISGDKVVILAPAQNGEVLDVDNAVDSILNSLEKKEAIVYLPMKTVRAQIREDNIDELGIVELIGRGQSDAAGSSSSRRHNIQVGSSKLDGVLIAPGEEFSLNKYLVPVDETNGFLPELVIKPGKLVKEFGGGLCQVATTTFRAALYSGLPITERKNHAFAVHYYDWPFPGPGVDATIYPPHPDLRFKNDTGHYILIQTSVSGNRLTYDLYGTKGNRRVEIENPQYVSRNPDGSSTTIFYRNIYSSDKLVKRDSFTSYYKPAGEFPREGN